MKIKITRVTIVENIEEYRKQVKEMFNAKVVLFNLEETDA